MERKKTLMCERNLDQLLPVHTTTRGQTHNAGMCLDRELNPPPFGGQNDTLAK